MEHLWIIWLTGLYPAIWAIAFIRAKAEPSDPTMEALLMTAMVCLWPLLLPVLSIRMTASLGAQHGRSLAARAREAEIDAKVKEARKATKAYEKALHLGEYNPDLVKIIEERDTMRTQLTRSKVTVSALMRALATEEVKVSDKRTGKRFRTGDDVWREWVKY